MGFVVIHNIDECSGQRQSNCHYAAVYIAGTGKKAKAHLVFYITDGHYKSDWWLFSVFWIDGICWKLLSKNY